MLMRLEATQLKNAPGEIQIPRAAGVATEQKKLAPNQIETPSR